MNAVSSLDDSLTSIQWLCQLESNKLLDNDDAKVNQRRESRTSLEMEHGNIEKNPYTKPHYSYATLIVFAINSSKEKRMTLQEIYAWIQENYPYYRFAKKGWKNSIRHNLSLHKFFIKEKRPSVLHGKGSYWRISPEGKENLMRDLFKQSQNLQPPYALLPHDPNRKLRPIMPKPNCDTDPSKVRYVPLLTCNLPIVFVPSTSLTSATPEGLAATDTVKHRSRMTLPATESETAATTLAQTMAEPSSFVSNSAHVPAESSSPEPCKVGSGVSGFQRKDRTSPNFHAKMQSPSNPKKLPNILRRKRKSRAQSPEVKTKVPTPHRPSVQPTLAAINSSQGTHSPKRNFDEFPNSLTELTSSPLGHNSSFDFLSGFCSPGFSPLRSPGRFGTYLTPLTHECDSGIMVTPVKGGLADLSFSWTPYKTGFTPFMSSPPNNITSSVGSQGCRKSLGLE